VNGRDLLKEMQSVILRCAHPWSEQRAQLFVAIWKNHFHLDHGFITASQEWTGFWRWMNHTTAPVEIRGASYRLWDQYWAGTIELTDLTLIARYQAMLDREKRDKHRLLGRL
jgi:hypothetical protein